MYLGTPYVGDAYIFCVVSSEEWCIQSPVHKPKTPGAGNFAQCFKMYNESPSKQSIVKEQIKEHQKTKSIGIILAGPGPQIGLGARLSGAEIVPNTKNKENQQKQQTHKEKQNTQNVGTILAGLGPQNGVCVRRRIDYSDRRPSKTKNIKQKHQTKTKTE